LAREWTTNHLLVVHFAVGFPIRTGQIYRNFDFGRPSQSTRQEAAKRGKKLAAKNSSVAEQTSWSGQWHAVSASFLGWTLDAFDFFVLVFLVDTLAAQFQVTKSAIVWTMTATLAMRPVGAIVFGLLADRYGRRKPLMANVVFFSVVELLCGFSPNYTVFLILRTIYGIGMGGEWGVGASLAMESAPARWRGILSVIIAKARNLLYRNAA